MSKPRSRALPHNAARTRNRRAALKAGEEAYRALYRVRLSAYMTEHQVGLKEAQAILRAEARAEDKRLYELHREACERTNRPEIAHGMQYSEIARRMKMEQATVRRWLSGKRILSAREFFRLAHVLAITPEALYRFLAPRWKEPVTPGAKKSGPYKIECSAQYLRNKYRGMYKGRKAGF